jgi:hypothetical protein
MMESKNESSTRYFEPINKPDPERQEFIERARQEIPALREQVASSLADLRRIAKS